MGDQNTVNQYQHPPKVINVMERRPGSVTAEDEHQISDWIAKLAEGETKMARKSAFGMWQNRFYKKFKVTKAGELDAAKMSDVKAWYSQRIAIQTRGLKYPAPDLWRNRRYGSIKGKMRALGIVDDQAYYLDLSERLKFKEPFTSLTDLTKANLDRVYRKVMEDARKSKS